MSALPNTSARGEIITFYSYKGGTGRTMAMANVACLLAEQIAPEQKILMMDWDLEAPGLHRFFPLRLGRSTDPNLGLDSAPGVIDLFRRLAELLPQEPASSEDEAEEATAKVLQTISIEQYVVPTDVPRVDLMRAGRNDDGEYPRRVNTFSWEALFGRAPNVYADVADLLARQYRYVLIDSRTGVTDISGICTSMLPEKLVVVFTPNRQSLSGLTDLVKRATDYRRRSDDLRPLLIYPLPSRIEGSLEKLRDLWRFGDRDKNIDGYEPLFERLLAQAYALSECDLADYFGAVQIQQTPDYAFGEEIAVRRKGDRLGIQESYRIFAEKLTSTVPIWKTVEPEAGAADFERPPVAAPVDSGNVSKDTQPAGEAPALVFFSYAGADRDRVRPIANALAAHGFAVHVEPSDVVPGSESLNKIGDALDRARVVLVFWSEASVKSDWVRDEAGEGLRRGILLPVLLDDVTPPIEFRRVVAADLRREPERAIPIVIDAVRKLASSAPGETVPDPGVLHRPVPLGWFAAVAAVSLVLAVILFGLLKDGPTSVNTGGGVQVSRVAVPEFIGLSIPDAEARAKDVRLTLIMKDSNGATATFVEGVVTKQTPEAGSLVPEADSVQLVVAILTRPMPAVQGMSLTDALKVLEEAHLKVGKTELRYAPGGELNDVIAQTPDPGTQIAADTAVDLVVARPPQLSDFRVGIYFFSGSNEAEKLATRVGGVVRSQESQVFLSPRDREFFDARGSLQHEIRYNSDAEREVAQQLQKLLDSSSFPSFKLKEVQSRTETFISVFLASASLVIVGNPGQSVEVTYRISQSQNGALVYSGRLAKDGRLELVVPRAIFNVRSSPRDNPIAANLYQSGPSYTVDISRPQTRGPAAAYR